MYIRLMMRAAVAALALASVLPGAASASMALQGQALRGPDPSQDVGAASAVVDGDWVAVFGRSMVSVGGGQVSLYHRGTNGAWTYAQTLLPPDDDACTDTMVMHGGMLFVSCPRALDLDRGLKVGVVAVYTLSGGVWQWSQTITSATGFFGNPGFGASLAVSDNRLFVGYPGFAPVLGVIAYGDVEVFDISSLPASYEMQITPDVPVAYSSFGSTIAATHGMLAVGANNQDVSVLDVSAGVVYTFEQSGSDWLQRSVLTASHPQPFDFFPSALTFQQSSLVAGSANNGSTNQDGSLGAAFTYGGINGSLALDDVLMPSESLTDTLFGQSLASIGGTVFVGEPGGGVGGRVHVYNSTPSGWAHSSAFAMATTSLGDDFGFALATDGQTLVVTAQRFPETGSGDVYVINAPPTDQIFGDGAEP